MREEERLGLLLSHTCTTLYLHQTDLGEGWARDRQINWNCHPLTVLPAGPYILALSADTLEIRRENLFSNLERQSCLYCTESEVELHLQNTLQ